MTKLFSALLVSFLASSVSAHAAGYAPGEIYMALRVQATEHCNDTEACKDAYVQVRTVGGLTCLFTVHSAAGSLVDFDCALTRGGHEAIYKALKVEERDDGSRTVKSVGGLTCVRDSGFFGSGGGTSCSLRR